MLSNIFTAVLVPTSPIGLVLALATGAVTAVFVIARSQRRGRWLVALGFGALTFQAAHLLEHLLQAGYWTFRPTDKPWLTPWADETASSLGYWCSLLPGGAKAALGPETLHLLGNAIFLVGLLALSAAVHQGWSDRVRPQALRRAQAVQLFHVAEHVVLVATVYLVDEPLGVSTGFGVLDAGPLAWSYRVWFHFGINAAATWYAVRAVWPVAPARPVPEQPAQHVDEPRMVMAA